MVEAIWPPGMGDWNIASKVYSLRTLDAALTEVCLSVSRSTASILSVTINKTVKIFSRMVAHSISRLSCYAGGAMGSDGMAACLNPWDLKCSKSVRVAANIPLVVSSE